MTPPRHLLPGAPLVRALALLLLLLAPASLPAQGDPDVLVDRLAGLLERREGDEFWVTVTRLEELGKEAVPALRDKLESPNEKTRLGCAKALLQIGDGDSQKKALAALADLARGSRDRDVRIDAIQVYGLKGDPDEVLEVLGGILEDTLDPFVQISLARTLWEVDFVTDARDRLVDLLASQEPEVRQEAALTLAEMEYFEGDVRDILRSLKKEPTPRGRRAALLDRVMRLSRQLERGLDAGRVLIEGTDPEKLLQIKDRRIRELEERIESVAEGAPAPAGGSAATREDRLLEEVVRLVQEHYVEEEKTHRRSLLLSAIEGMVRALDPHSMFMDVEATREFSQGLHGEYHGIGAQVSKQPEEPLEILRPIYGGPAFGEGILSGDRVLEIDGVATPQLTMEEIMKLLKGPKGTTVELTVYRRGWTEPRSFEIRRDTVEVPSVYYEKLPEDVGYIQLTQFGFRSIGEFRSALEKLEEEDLRGLVIDLRNNPGGTLKAALTITDLFVSGDLPIVTERGREGARELPHYPSEAARTGYPIVVLVNENSASASEILAGALQDYGRARLVGRRTYGKGSVQQPIALETVDGTQLKLTVRYYFLPHGRCIHTRRDGDGRIIERGGIEPDVRVEEEAIPSWRYDARIELRNHPDLLDYVDEHFDALAELVPLGDRGDHDRYPELDELLSKLSTRALEADVRAVIRHHVGRRLEDRRGRQIPFDLVEDRQLQVAIREVLRLAGEDVAELPDYGWIEPPEETSGEAEETAGAEDGDGSDEGGAPEDDAASPDPVEEPLEAPAGKP